MNGRRFIIWIYLLAASHIAFSQTNLNNDYDQIEGATFIATTYEDFNIIFLQDFENTSVGTYDYKQFTDDWNNPPFGEKYCKRTLIVDYNLGGRSSRGMKWTFPENTYGVSDDFGYIWWAPLGDDLEECYLSYSIMFKPGFQSVLGGKLPGLREEHTWSGQRPSWDSGYKGSLMFKAGKNGAPMPVFYIYHHDQILETIGDTKSWNGYTFDVSTDTWYDITYRVVMNKATATDAEGPDGEKDGIIEGYVNGKLWGQVTGLRLRNIADLGTDQIAVNAFFGGSTEDWCTIRDEWMMIDNVYVWSYSAEYLEKHPEVKRGRQANSLGDTIYTPFDVFFNEDEDSGSDPIASDEIPPTIPSDLKAIDSTQNSITITWNSASDNTGVTGYKVFTNDKISGATGNTIYTLTSLSPNTQYKIAVTAFDAESNESPKSSAISVYTQIQDTIPPTVPSNVAVNRITSSSLDITWNASQDNVGIDKYEVYLDGEPKYTTGEKYITISQLQANKIYRISVKAYDTSNNGSPLSDAISVTTKPPDTEPPTTPVGLKISEITETTISLLWDPSSDNVGVKNYRIYANNVERETSTRTDATLNQLQPGLSYSISVSAVDEAANESLRSADIEVSTRNSDITTQPTLPTISIIDVQNNTFQPTSTSELVSLGFAELKNYGLEISKTDNPGKETIILQGIESTHIINENRIKEGLQVLYNFAEGRGTTVKDISGVEQPMDLNISREGLATQWLTGQGLRIVENTIICCKENPTRLINALSATNEITLEAWVKQEKVGQSGPARLLTLSADNSRRAITLAHEGNKAYYNYVSRVNTSQTDINGAPEIKTSQNFISSSLHHVVYTRNNLGRENIYINGMMLASGNREGDFSSWESDYKFALANEISGERPWNGIFYLVAVYNRALSSEEVNQNYDSGFGQIRFTNELDTLESNVAYTLKPFVITDQGLVYGKTRDFMYQNVAQSDNLFSLYPNPNSGSIFISVKSRDENIKQGYLRLTDFTGTLHFTEVLDLSEGLLEKVFEFQLPFSLKNGLYSLILNTGTSSVAQKFILMR